jgi:hypothetical protein
MTERREVIPENRRAAAVIRDRRNGKPLMGRHDG